MRKPTRALAMLLASVNQSIHAAAIRAEAGDLSFPQLALISRGISPSLKLLPLRSQLSCPLHKAFDQRVPGTKAAARKLFLRASWEGFKGWESNLQLLCSGPGELRREYSSW